MTREQIRRREWWAFFVTVPVVMWSVWSPETRPRSVPEFIGGMVPMCAMAALFVKAWFRVWRSLTMRDVPVPGGMGIVRRGARAVWVVVAYAITLVSVAAFFQSPIFRFAPQLWVPLILFAVIAGVVRLRRGVTDTRS